MSESNTEQRPASKPGLYQEITDKIIRQIEAGTIPWVQPWAEDQTLSIPRNATTNRAYSGVNILLLWDALFDRGYSVNRWLTFKQALQFGANVRKGERGTTVVYADTFTPKKDGSAVGTTPSGGDGNSEDCGRRIPFLKRFTVFNVSQCDGLPFDYTAQPKQVSQALPIPAAEALIAATGAQFQRDDTKAYYHTGSDSIHTPPQESFFEPINFYRTALHELTHYAAFRIMPRRCGSTCYSDLDRRGISA
jgi:antirestriction protein ArdC